MVSERKILADSIRLLLSFSKPVSTMQLREWSAVITKNMCDSEQLRRLI